MADEASYNDKLAYEAAGMVAKVGLPLMFVAATGTAFYVGHKDRKHRQREAQLASAQRAPSPHAQSPGRSATPSAARSNSAGRVNPAVLPARPQSTLHPSTRGTRGSRQDGDGIELQPIPQTARRSHSGR